MLAEKIIMTNEQKKPIVAYFSMEIGLENNIKTYSGGLGVLAGDILKSAANANFPMVGITLFNDQGYFKQTISKNGQQEFGPDDKYDFSKLEKLSAQIEILIGNDKVLVGVWQYFIVGHNDFVVPVYFLDTNINGNKDIYKNLTGELYGGDNEYRLRQEIILGRGGVKMLQKLGYQDIKKFHLNEGHGALAAIELFLNSEKKSDEAKIKDVRSHCVFTTHTPIPKAHDIFSKEYLLKYQKDFPAHLTALYDEEGNIHFTSLGLYFSGYSNAVSRLHQETCQKMYPNYKINFVTNGVNSEFWSAPEFGELYNKYMPAWLNDGANLVKAKIIPPEEIWSAHQAAKRRLAEYINLHLLEQIDENIFTIGFARRFATYKQPKYLFQDIEKLLAINENIGKIQIIYAGKAHPRDAAGQEMIKFIHDLKKKLKGKIKIIFLSDYDLD
ncbi:MAG: starch phosphorylase, partial [Parcubacteria group bacterium Athens0714_26]